MTMFETLSTYSLPYKPEDISKMTPGEKRKYGICDKSTCSASGEYDHINGTRYSCDHSIGRDC